MLFETVELRGVVMLHCLLQRERERERERNGREGRRERGRDTEFISLLVGVGE